MYQLNSDYNLITLKCFCLVFFFFFFFFWGGVGVYLYCIFMYFCPPTDKFEGYSDLPGVRLSVCPSVCRRNLVRPITPIPFELFS